MTDLLRFLGKMGEVMKRVENNEITKEEGAELLKNFLEDFMDKENFKHMSREEKLAVAIEHNAAFRSLPVWKDDLDEMWQRIRRTINNVGALQEQMILEDIGKQANNTHTVVQLHSRLSVHKALANLNSALMTYAKVMGVVDSSPFDEWHDNQKKED